MSTNIIQHSDLLLLSNDKQQLLVRIVPIENDINEEQLIQLFNKSPHSSFKLNLQALTQAAHALHQLYIGKNSSTKSIVIAEREDAQLTISIEPMKMVAKAQIISAFGGNQITRQQLENNLSELGIEHGIKHKVFDILIEKSVTSKAGTSVQATIAQGTAAVNGVDANFQRLVETPKERLLRPTEGEDGKVDMRDLGELVTVKPGSQLMRKIPYVEGSSGINVLGEIIEHIPGKDYDLIEGTNTKISDSDTNILVATLTGIPKAIEKGMQVDDVLLIGNVDVGYGHVNYDGSIIIEGNICDGMHVQSSGDITVSGFVESAEINCGGDLLVGEGIIGRKIEEDDHDYTCKISSKGAVVANFSQYSQITAGDDVTIKKQLLHCHVDTKGNIDVGDEGGLKGTILGGILRTHKGINTVTLGASAGSKTIIDLVGLYPKLMAERKLIKQCIIEEQNKLESLISAQRKIDILPESEKKQVLDTRLQLTKETVKKLITSLNEELSNKNLELQKYFEEAKVISKKTLHNDVKISVGRETFCSKRNYGPTQVAIKNYKLAIEPYQR